MVAMGGAHKMDRAEYLKNWRAKNKEKWRSYVRTWEKKNPEKAYRKHRRWVEKNIHKRQEYYRIYSIVNAEEIQSRRIKRLAPEQSMFVAFSELKDNIADTNQPTPFEIICMAEEQP